MENANRAIMIAGAVLIVLLVLTLMMYFLTKSGDFVSIFGTKITKSEMENHNNKYTVYEGEQMGNKVINACIKIMTEIDEGNIEIRYDVNGTEYHITKDYRDDYDDLLNDIKKTRIYKVTLSYNSQGLVNGLIITDIDD